MKKSLAVGTCVVALAVTLWPGVASAAAGDHEGKITGSAAAGPAVGALRAGVASVDATWHVGSSSGQYADDEVSTDPPTSAGDVTDDGQQAIQNEWDPNVEHTIKAPSYGVQSRLNVRALVLSGGTGAPVALVKQDLYLAQDLVTRRAAAILAADGSKVTYANLILSTTHDHSSPYYSTPSAGVYVFQDAFDLRFFEYQARAIAHAVEHAEAAMRPAKLGATTIDAPFVQTNIVGPATADDGTPAGYPRDENDHGLVVMRVDGTDGSPIATWVNFGQHPEGLDGYSLESEDYLAPMQRYVDAETGGLMVFSQGGVGSSEGPYEGYYPRGSEPRLASGSSAGVIKAFAHVGHAQVERGGRILADYVMQGWRAIGAGAAGVQVPMSDTMPVAAVLDWIPGPVSHPYPSYGNCNSAGTVNGDPGVGGLPDCERAGTGVNSGLYQSLVAAGLPIPAGYAATDFSLVEENARIKLQAVRIGDILLASCSCEPQVDLVKNLETKLDDVAGNEYNGWNYPCTQNADTTWLCDQVNVGLPAGHKYFTVTNALYLKMRAEVNNDAAGWDDPAYAGQANAEPADPALIKGNFTHTELPAAKGFHLVVALGHTGDYDGYTVSYREFMNRESYRKSLTAYGPHSADYYNTHLMEAALNLRDGTPIPPVINAAQGDADEQREAAEATTLGQLGSFYLDGWDATRPDDAGPAAITTQPVASLQRFGAASVSWQGGSNWTDNPDVHVQRLVSGVWTPYADMSGQVVTTLTVPPGVTTLATDETGTQSWRWTATFEAYDSWPRADVDGGQVPSGTYRFVMAGMIHQAGASVPYGLTSTSFVVAPWEGLKVSDPALTAGNGVRFTTAPVVYPRTYAADASFRMIKDDLGDDGTTAHRLFCRTCSVRPWARTGTVAGLTVSVWRDGMVVRTVPAVQQADGSWTAATALVPGEVAYVRRAGETDTYGEINGAPTRAIGPDGVLVAAPDSGVTPALPETPLPFALPLVGLALTGLLLLRRRRRRV